MPIFSFDKVKNGELKYMYIKNRSSKISIREQNRLSFAFEKIFDQYFMEFGITDKFKEHMRKRVNIAEMKANCIMQNKPHLMTLIEIKEHEMIQDEEIHAQSLMDTTVLIEKQLGFVIDVHSCSVSKFYTYIKQLNK